VCVCVCPYQGSGLAALPAPKKKKVVAFHLQYNRAALTRKAAELEEDAGEVSRHKRHKQAPKGLSLREMLPRAKEDLGFGGGSSGLGGGTMLDLGTPRSSAAAAPGPSSQAQLGASQYAEPAPQYMYEHQVYVPPREVDDHGVEGSYTPMGVSQLEETLVGPSRPSTAPPTQDELLHLAMQEEMMRSSRQGRGSNPFRKIEMPKMVEVSQLSLTSFARPVEAVNDVGRAFGPQYAAQLKKQAGDRPERLQRSKHQIGSLYYDAKVRELEMFENQTKGMKSRKETQGKYGWI